MDGTRDGYSKVRVVKRRCDVGVDGSEEKAIEG